MILIFGIFRFHFGILKYMLYIKPEHSSLFTLRDGNGLISVQHCDVLQHVGVVEEPRDADESVLPGLTKEKAAVKKVDLDVAFEAIVDKNALGKFENIFPLALKSLFLNSPEFCRSLL